MKLLREVILFLVSLALMLLAVACAPTRSIWYERGLEVARQPNPQGAAAVEWCRIMNPIGDNAGMSDDEKRAAIRDLADGWRDGSR